MIKFPIAGILANLLLFGGILNVCAEESKKTPTWTSTEELQSFMFPPEGWKIDFEELDKYFWVLKPPTSFNKNCIPVMPFWPDFIALDFDGTTHRLKDRPLRYVGMGAKLLERQLKSDDAVTREAANVWWRQSAILYFAGFRMSKHKDVGYAPWIHREQAQRINDAVDHYLSQLRPMPLTISQFGVGKETVCTDTNLSEVMGELADKRKATVFNYFGSYQSYESFVPTYFVYPFYWLWVSSEENTDGDTVSFSYQPYLNDEVSEDYMAHLIGGTLPKSEDDEVRLWSRDVYLSFVAGKLLFENKLCPIKEGKKQALLNSAVQEWWIRARKQQQEEWKASQ